MRVTVAKDGWRWRAQSNNCEQRSGEAYKDKSYAIDAARKFGPGDAVIDSED